MKTLITQVGTYVTADAVAEAVVQYWLALTEERRADVVEIPILGLDDRRSFVRLTLGASSPIAVTEADQVNGFDDDGAAGRLLARVRSLTHNAGPAFAPGELPDVPNGGDGSLL